MADMQTMFPGVVCECSTYMISKKAGVLASLSIRARERGLLIREIDLDATVETHDAHGIDSKQTPHNSAAHNLPQAILHKVRHD